MAHPVAPLPEATDVAIVLLRREPRIHETGEALLEHIARAASCEWGAYWAIDPLSHRLRVIAIWSALGEAGEHFKRDTYQHRLAPNAGNAGQVWRNRKPIWATNLMLEMCLARALPASQAGLRGGVWFGVQSDTAVYGVIELLARVMPHERQEETLLALERAGFRLGYTLEELQDAASQAP